VLGEGIQLHEIQTMEDAVLVGIFSSKIMSMDMLKKWKMKTFIGILGYS
jgi:hypothetical protein